MFGRTGSGSGGGGGGGAVNPSTAASPPPVSSNPENNACKLIDYRGTKVAAFSVDGRELICLPQAFELFLKHLVGGLHTVYTKLKRLDVVPVVCNVEQVRVLRGLGAIQPGVNRCKLISPKEFDILYEDCTNSSARPGRPPKRSALAMTPDGLDKLKKNRIQMASDFYSPAASASLIGDAKKSLGFGGNYMPFSELQKSPLLASGFHYPPAHLAHLAFMPLGHPGMMNLAMATHLSNMREHLVSSAALDRSIHGPDVTSSRCRGEDRMVEMRSSEEHNNNCNNNSSSKAGAAAAAAAMRMMIAPPGPHLSDASLDRPLNLEVQKKSSFDTPRPPSNATDHESSVGSTAANDQPLSSGQLDLSKRSSVLGNGVSHYGHNDRNYVHDLRQFGSNDRLYANDDRHYENDQMDTDDEDSAEERSEDDQDGSVSLKGYPYGGRMSNGEALDKVTGGPPPPSSTGYFLTNSADMSTLETLLVNIQGLVKLAVEKTCQKEQQINFERADMKMKATKEREVREMLEKELMDERRKKASLHRKLKKERRTRRGLQDRLQSLDRGPAGHCYAPVTNALHAALHQAVPASGADCSGGSSGDGCRDDRHLGLLLIQGQDKRRLRNASASAEDANESELDGSCGSDTERRQEERPNSIQSLMEGFISSAQKGSTGGGNGLCNSSNSSSSNGYNAQLPALKASDTP